MAVLQQKEAKTIRMVKKETTLKQDTWSLISSYIKYAGIKGSQVEKRNFVIEGALNYLFENDKEFIEYVGKETAKKEEAVVKKEEVPVKKEVVKPMIETVKNK